MILKHGRRLAALVIAVLAIAVMMPGTASASISPGDAALDWAEANAAGHWYQWGGTGPGYDCSGLVYESFLHQGIVLPRTTYQMLGSWHLIRTYHPRRGDIAFYGAGHVEIVTAWPGVTFGALDYGTRVGWHRASGWWYPTMFFAVR